MFWFFGHEAYGILAPWPGIEPEPPAFEGEMTFSFEYMEDRCQWDTMHWFNLFIHLLNKPLLGINYALC